MSTPALTLLLGRDNTCLMKLRTETPADRDAVHALVTAAFGQPQEADLIEALHRSGDVALSLMAEEEGDIAGQVLFSRLRAPEGCLALAPVSVAPDRQNQGIGSHLIREGLARMGAEGWQAVFLLGEPDYYRRFGFSHEAAAGFETVYPRAYFMALELRAGALNGLSGPVVYAAPFEALG